MQIAIVEPKSLIGEELIRLLLEEGRDPDSLSLFAEVESELEIEGEIFPVAVLSPEAFEEIDSTFFCCDLSLSKKYIPFARHHQSAVIDLSSAFSMHTHVPLVIPALNKETIKDHKLIASPNCIVTILASLLAPLHHQAKIRRITLSTYQAVSGGGKALLQSLLDQKEDTCLPIHHNLYPHDSKKLESGYVAEELQIIQEMRKILGEEIEVAVTAVRVPILRAHSISVSLECENTMHAKEAISLLSSADGIYYTEDTDKLTPLYASHKEFIVCGRVKDDLFRRNTIHLWVVSDQLLKGTALNALEIFHVMKDALQEKVQTCQ